MWTAPVLDAQEMHHLRRELEGIRRRLREVEVRVPRDGFGPDWRSVQNLVHYLALRQYDLRQVQERLAALGLSSLGRAEGHVLHNLETVIAQLDQGCSPPSAATVGGSPLGPGDAKRILARNVARLFGRPPKGRQTRIMVTLPQEAARDPELVRELVESGMDSARINCAHDSREDWSRMVAHVRAAERATGRRCRILMDISGPRLRTGAIAPGPAVLKVRPERDPFGHVVRPGELRLVDRDLPAAASTSAGPSSLRVAGAWLARRRTREVLELRDARGAHRTLLVRSRGPGELTVEVPRTTYFTNGTTVAGAPRQGEHDLCVLTDVEAPPGRLRLSTGDLLMLLPGEGPGRPAEGEGARSSRPASVPLALPELVHALRPGHRIWFDGGRLGGRVLSVGRSGALVRVDHAPPKGTWLRADQGVNLPDTQLDLPPLTVQDHRDLEFIARHADLVGYSFVGSGHDIGELRRLLARLGRPSMGIVLKIETRHAFEQLPELLLGALRWGPAGVMVARGDLAVEVGFDRLAEVQEEILWLCEAAHLPAVWATQVLEGLAQNGVPSRAEVTDAAMGERAECIMLNKGPYLVQAVQALDSIIRRMQTHQEKKSARLRHLDVAERFLLAHASGSGSPKSSGPRKPTGGAPKESTRSWKARSAPGPSRPRKVVRASKIASLPSV